MPPDELLSELLELLLLVVVIVCGIYSQNSRVTGSCPFLFSALWLMPLNKTFSTPCAAVSSLTMGMGCGTLCPGFRKIARTTASRWYLVCVGVSSRISSILTFASSYPVACLGFDALPSTCCSSIAADSLTSMLLRSPGRTTPFTLVSARWSGRRLSRRLRRRCRWCSPRSPRGA